MTMAIFEVDKKFQRISIAFINFYDLNDLKNTPSAISIDRELVGVQRITTYKNFHKRSWMAT